jgi:poly-gamma-glutamate synthesis protein (capsule biosynthesis protein)
MYKFFIKQKPRFFSSFILLIIIGILLEVFACDSPKAQATTENSILQEDSLIIVRIIAAGDAMVHSPQITWAKDPETNTYNYSGCFQYLEDILSQGDLNIVNLETTLAGAPYSGYPQFCAPDEFATALRNAGFNFFLLANNHSADKGTKGVKLTIEKMQNWNIPTAGTYLDEQDRDNRYPAIMDVNGIKIALLNYTYGTNGLTVNPPVSVNDLNDTLQIKEDIKAAKDKQPDIILAFLHWGTEYQRYPNKKQKEQATFFFQQGIDVIVGSHPHVVQPVEYFAYDKSDTTKKKLVYWSLGNFISNQRKEYTDGGILASFSIVKNKNTQSVRVEDTDAIPYWVYRNTDIRPGYFVLPVERFLDDTLSFSVEDKTAFEKFVRNTNELLGRK